MRPRPLASPPPLGGVVFIGSSSIQHWSQVAADFPGVPVLNRGFGGSTLADVVYYEDRVLLPYQKAGGMTWLHFTNP